MNTFNFIKLIIRTTINTITYYSGIHKLYLKTKKKGIIFIAYHDISNRDYLYLQISPELFERHIKYLLRNYKIISLSEALRMLNNLHPINDNYVVITFDDGYKGVYTEAYPILKKYNIPFTVFLTTESIDTGIPPFVDCLAYAVQKTKKEELDLRSFGLRIYKLNKSHLREAAIMEINDFSKSMSSNKRKEFLYYIFKQLYVSLYSEELKNVMLSWKEVIEMSSDNLVEFGAHTHTHPSLSKIPINDAKNDILYSKKKIESITNKEVNCFAYPYGTEDDINSDIVNFVSNCGFKSAFTLTSSELSIFNLFNIPRICIISPTRSLIYSPFSIPYFATTVSGFYNLLKRKGTKKSLTPFYIPYNHNDKMKIFYFIDNLYLTAGTERHLTYLVNYLDKNSFSPVICAFKASQEASDSFKEKGVPFINLNLDRIYTYSALKTLSYLMKILRSFSPDIVQTFHFKSDTYGVLAAKLAGVKHIISSRRDTGDLKKPRQILLNKIANRFIDKFIMVCDRVGESFHKLEGIPYEKMVTLYNGVDINRFHPQNGKNPLDLRAMLGYKEDDFIVGTTAIFRPEKAYHVLFEGVEKVMPKIPNLKVVICGDGPTKKHFEDYCKTHPVGKIVKFMGYVHNTENYLPLMDVFCLVPNKNEGFSNAILEAMAMARPVIATDVGGNAEAVVHGETGIIIPPDDSDSLAEAIMDLYRNPEKRLQMAQKARERAVNVFSLERMIKEHENFYLSLINEPK